MIAVEWDGEQHGLRVIQEKVAIRGQVVKILWMLGRFEQDRLRRGPDRFLEEIEAAHPLRDIRHRSAVMRPQGIQFVRGIEGEPSRDVVRQVEGPDIPGAGFRVQARDGDACIVGRESDLVVGTRFADGAERIASSIEPRERGCHAGRLSGSVHEHAGLGYVEGGAPAARNVRDVFSEDNRIARQAQPLCVERLRQERTRSLKDQEARRCISHHRIDIDQPCVLRRIERPDDGRMRIGLQAPD